MGGVALLTVDAVARPRERCREKGIYRAEASLILETNTRMRSPIEKMGGVITKTYRSYQLRLDG